MAKFVSIYFKAPDFMKSHKFGTANIFFPLHKDYAGFLFKLGWRNYFYLSSDVETWSIME